MPSCIFDFSYKMFRYTMFNPLPQEPGLNDEVAIQYTKGKSITVFRGGERCWKSQSICECPSNQMPEK